MADDLSERVYSGPASQLRRVEALLRDAGIASRHTRPRRREGVLCVALADGARARGCIERCPKLSGTLVSAEEAAWFRCYACGATLSEGVERCASCGADVGDPHGR